MAVIKIIHDNVYGSIDNGISTNHYEGGKVYDVPDFLANGFVARGWAELATDADKKASVEEAKSMKVETPVVEIETKEDVKVEASEPSSDEPAIAPKKRGRKSKKIEEELETKDNDNG